MKTMIHTCDICKQSKSDSDLSQIKVSTNGIKFLDNNHYRPMEIDICADCLKRKGFLVASVPDDQVEGAQKQQVKTLKDKLLDILEDMGVAFQE